MIGTGIPCPIIRISCIYIIVIFLLYPVFAEKVSDLTVSGISIQEGLSQNTVNSILQDERGFLWFGTQDGLNRYDGYTIRVFRSDPSSVSSISSGYVTDLEESPDGIMWIGTLSGLNRFDPKTEEFTRFFYQNGNDSSLSDNQIHDLCLDKKGRLWIATDQGGLNVLDTHSGQFTHWKKCDDDENSIISNRIWQITDDPNGNIWLNTPSGLDYFTPVTGIFKHYFHDPDNPASLSVNETLASLWDENGFLWVVSPLGVDKLDLNTDNVTHYLFAISGSESGIGLKEGAIIQSSDNKLWIGTRGSGLRVFDPLSETFTYYPGESHDLGFLQSNAVRSLYEDASGSIWIGTDDSGVYLYNPRVEQFTVYRNNPLDPDSLSTSDIFGIYADGDILWIGGADGSLNRFDRKTNTNLIIPQDADDPLALAPSRILGPIIPDKKGNIWIGTGGGEGLFRFSPHLGKFTRYSHDPDNPQSINNNNVICMYEDSLGNIWAGTDAGLNLLDQTMGNFTSWNHDPENPESISSNDIRAIIEDSDGTFLVGTLGGGLNRFNLTTGVFTRFLHDPNDITSLSDNEVLAIFKNSDGFFWIGTGNGLNKFDGNSSFLKYTIEDGLPNACIYGILEDDKGNIWVSTNRGIACLDPVSGEVNSYTSHDGIASDEHNSGAYYLAPDGEMFFGGISGITAFYPDRIVPNPNVPPVVLTDFLLSNKPVPIGNSSVLSRSVTYSDEIILSYLDSIFSIEFCALNFVNPKENQYRYKLAGFDDDWNEVDSSRRTATYTNMRPGRYEFIVEASNDDNVWNTTGTSLYINITPPWWETWWFRSFLLISLCALVYIAYRARIENFRRRNEELENLVKTRTMELETAKEKAELANRAKTDFISNMSHELRTPLNAILGYAQILSRQNNLTDTQKKQVGTIQKSGEHLLRLINDILNMGRIESRNIELQVSDFHLPSMIQEIINIIRVKTDEKGLTFQYEKPGLMPEYVNGDERKIQQIFLNLLSNAVRYTNTGSVSLAISYVENTLSVSVSDTGIGIPHEKKEQIFEPFTRLEAQGHTADGVGLGLSITKELINLMHGTIDVDSEEGKGSRFSVTLPLPKVVGGTTLDDDRPLITGYLGERKSILVVDDHRENAGLMVSLLEPLGFMMYVAYNGNDALLMIKEESPSLILLDFVMPGMNGLDFVTILRNNPDMMNIRVIGVSASVQGDDRKDAFVKLCDDFIDKPVRYERLLDGIGRVLGISWISDPDINRTIPENNLDEGHEISVPPVDVREKIRKLVKEGDYHGLEQVVSLLSDQNNDYKAFYKKVSQYIEKYDDVSIIEFIDSFDQ
ncbi:two-component regulator propeller domain-containing protein [Methanospirillum stamsii]|uniref:Histidine kinase n=1 Tax=Methanospirillum stamsii TaxID=1277351 RepID=A0A2V2MQF7_9EURY|nr:two-component regulator propeller domain-containing protein [Methanospirillum stamsii]PWR70474.1 hypothetical protein DLD82_15490 [Methanospirillum stamsii]